MPAPAAASAIRRSIHHRPALAARTGATLFHGRELLALLRGQDGHHALLDLGP